MSRFALAALVVCLGSVRLLGADDGFQPLFDGQSLEGWHGEQAFWSVRDGAIVGKCDGNIPANTFLITDREFDNFILKVKFRLHNHKGNSGIQFRSEELPATGNRPKFVIKGYQADIADNHYMGILYGESTGRGIIVDLSPDLREKVANAINRDGWNEYVIVANGDHITQTLNGVKTVDIKDPEGARKGVIALQLHRGHDMEISFKDILIKPLQTSE